MYDYTGKNPVEMALYVFTLAAGIWYFKSDKKLSVITYSIIFVTFIIPFIISVSAVSILHNRYLIVTLPALFLLTAHIYTERTKNLPKLNTGLTIFILLAMFINNAFINKTFKEGKEPWKEVAATYKTLCSKQPLPIVAQENMYINYYLTKEGLNPSVTLADATTFPEFWYLEHKYNAGGSLEQLKQTHTITETLEFSHEFLLLKVKSNSK
jgi:hypothetical protein